MLLAGDTHVFPITTLDGANIGDGRVGPVAAALLRALERRRRRRLKLLWIEL